MPKMPSLIPPVSFDSKNSIGLPCNIDWMSRIRCRYSACCNADEESARCLARGADIHRNWRFGQRPLYLRNVGGNRASEP